MAEALVGSLVVLSFLPVLLIGLAIAYLSLRIRDSRADPPDPELGIKAGYYFFLTAGIFLALTGLTISVTDLLDDAFGGKQAQQAPPFNPQGRFGPPPPARPDDPFDSMSQRVAWPLVISGVLFALVGLLLVKTGTNDAQFPSVRRTFVGLRMAVSGLNVMVGVTLLIELVFQKALPNMRPFAVAVGLIAVWLPTTLVHIFLMKQYGKLPYYVPPKPKKSAARHDNEEFDDEDEEDRPRGRRRTGRRDEEREADEE
jgi:hypothetical protein